MKRKKMEEVNIGETKSYEFERSMLYKYMVYSFQCVDPCLENYKSKTNFFCQFGRVVVALLIWFLIGFAFFYTIETLNLPVVNALTHYILFSLDTKLVHCDRFSVTILVYNCFKKILVKS